MSPLEMESIRFGLYLAAVGIAVTFGSLIFLYLIIRLFARLERRAEARADQAALSSAELPPEAMAAVGVAIDKYLEGEREHLAPEIRLQERKPSAWRVSGRSED